MTKNSLYYGDNLDILRNKIQTESVDLCYIDPPFNSKRNYNQIYNNIGGEDRALVQAFIDTWTWDTDAAQGFEQILTNHQGRFQAATIELIKGLRNVLKEGSLLAYLVSMALRITEIQRVLRPTGSFYLHCDPTASHYLKLVIDSVFVSQGGEFQNELIWCYSQGGKSRKHFGRKHDVIFFYSKGDEFVFNHDQIRMPLTPHKQDRSGKNFGGRMGFDEHGREYVEKWGTGKKKLYRYYLDEGKIPEDWWVDINSIQADAGERLGYPTQKPEALLERIIKASSNRGDAVLDAYCGCGTTVAMAQRLDRRWIGIDITYQSISLILKRLEEAVGREVLSTIRLDGIPKDMASATALAHKHDDRVRKEFEKWAVLTYSENKAVINQKKGADGGIDGTAYFMTSQTENEKIIFQVKSGNVGAKDIRDLRGTIEQEKAPLGIFITLQDPSKPMTTAAHAAGSYAHPLMQRNYDRIKIVTIQEMIEKGIRLEMPLTHEVVKLAAAQSTAHQLELLN